MSKDESREEQLLDSIYDALDRQEPGTALELAIGALGEQQEEDPVLRFLSGVALLELDRVSEAVTHLHRAVELDPDDAEFRAHLAIALYRRCSFDEAGPHARAALAADPSLPDAQATSALLLERQGRRQEADEHFARAAALDPERFPLPVRMPRNAFEKEVERAGELLPGEFKRRLDEVAILVEDLPSEEILFEEAVPLDPELLGLFVGTPLSERSYSGPFEHPPRILLFQRNLERFARDRAELRGEIARTLYHELGHYLGLDEDELEEIDLG